MNLNKILILVSVLLLFCIVTFNVSQSVVTKPPLASVEESSQVDVIVDDQTGIADSAADTNTDDSDKSTTTKNDANAYYNLNNVTFNQLLTVDGIGEVKAQAILALRDELGGYTSVEQLKEVSGIGDKTYQKIAPHFYV